MGTFDSLRIRNFRLILLGTTLNNAAQFIQGVTLNWLVFDMTGSGAMLGTINLVRAVAMVGTSPVSGAAIDRFPRRNLMIGIALWLMLISTVLGGVLLSGARELWFLFVFTALGGVAQSFDQPLRQTLVFTLVPRAVAPNAVALIQTGWGLMRSLGPAIGGFLILWFGPGGNFLIQACAYALVAFNVLRIQFPPHVKSTTYMPITKRIREGLAYVGSQKTTRTFLFFGWTVPLFVIPMYSALPPIYAREVYGGGPDTLGLLLSSVGIGGIFGGILSASLGGVDRRGLVQISALFMIGVSFAGFALSQRFELGLFFMACSGFFEMIFITSNQTLMQLSIPDELRGRVTSITSLSMALTPMGALIGGVGSDLVGPREITFALAGVEAAIAVGVFLFVPVVREHRMSRAIRQQRTQ